MAGRLYASFLYKEIYNNNIPTVKELHDKLYDIVVWMDTIQSGRFEDTNKLFVQPKNYDYRISNLTD